MAEVRFDGAYGVCGVRVACVISSGIKYAINKCSSKCFSIFYDNSTVHDLLYHGKAFCQDGLNVSMAV